MKECTGIQMIFLGTDSGDFKKIPSYQIHTEKKKKIFLFTESKDAELN